MARYVDSTAGGPKRRRSMKGSLVKHKTSTQNPKTRITLAARGQHARNARRGGRPRAHGLVGFDVHEVILVDRIFRR